MKVLIIGKNGYVAKNVVTAFEKSAAIADVHAISVRSGSAEVDFTGYDVCIHTAALVHKKESDYKEADYFHVNTELTLALAEKAKSQGIKQFVFLSTMAVFGQEQGEITEKSELNPKTFYGKSKLAAEQALQAMQDEHFAISIVRPPMIYGPNCPGNYALLRKLAKKTPIFPFVKNERSMLFIDHLCAMLEQLIVNRDAGIFHPQDGTFINTAEMVRSISGQHKKPLYFSRLGGAMLRIVRGHVPIVTKVFGNLTYAQEMSQYKQNSYQNFSLNEAIAKTEQQWKEGNE